MDDTNMRRTKFWVRTRKQYSSQYNHHAALFLPHTLGFEKRMKTDHLVKKRMMVAQTLLASKMPRRSERKDHQRVTFTAWY